MPASTVPCGRLLICVKKPSRASLTWINAAPAGVGNLIASSRAGRALKPEIAMKRSSIGLVIAIAMCAGTTASLAQTQTGKPGQHTEAATAPAAKPSTSTEQAGQSDKQRIETIRGYSVERRDEAIAAARRATDEMDRQMERLQTQMSEGWSRMSAASRERSRKAMADLRMRRNTLAEWIGGMKHGSSDAWTEVKGGFARSYDELAVAVRKARAEFEKARHEQTPKPADQQPGDKKGR
jgi:hypothetical protein